MQGYTVKEKTAIVPPVSKLSGHPESILNDMEVRKIYRLEETKVAGPSAPRISTGPAGRSLFCLTGPTVNILAPGQRLCQTLSWREQVNFQ